jgi:hypothetical protein
VLKSDDVRDRISSKLASPKTDQTAEVSIDDLGLDLDHLEASSPPSLDESPLEVTDHPSDAPTMVAGLDEKSRRLMAEADSRAREKDMTELERELEASFIADLGPEVDDSKTAILGPESAATVQMPREHRDRSGDDLALQNTGNVRYSGAGQARCRIDIAPAQLESGRQHRPGSRQTRKRFGLRRYRRAAARRG